MLTVNLFDGETLRFDMQKQEDAERWSTLSRDHAFQSRIRGLALIQNGVNYALPRPTGFDAIFFAAEPLEAEGVKKGVEQLICHAGDIQVRLVAHNDPRASRVDIARIGRMRYNPRLDGERRR